MPGPPPLVAVFSTKLCSSHQMDYEATMAFKKAFARKVFDLYGAETTNSAEFKVCEADLPGFGPYCSTHMHTPSELTL